MKILIAAPEIGETNGGKGRYPLCLMQKLVPELRARGCRVTILAPKDAPLDFPAGQAAIVRLPVRKNTGVWRAVWEELYIPRYAWGADVFVSMSGLFPSGPVWARKKITVAYDIHPIQHQADPQKYPGTYTRKGLLRIAHGMRKAILDADRIVTISQSTREEIHACFGIPSEEMVVIPCGVDRRLFCPQAPERVDEVRKLYHLPPEFYLFIGYPHPAAGEKKNLHLIVETYSRAHDDESLFLPVVIAGGERAGYRREPEYLSFGGTVGRNKFQYIGFVWDRDFPALYTAARALIFPSLHEGFGIPPLEAMACGTPVIAANRPAIPEVVGDAALLIDPLQSDSLLAALCQVNKEPVRKILIAQGLERTLLFSWESGAERLLHLILDLGGKS